MPSRSAFSSPCSSLPAHAAGPCVHSQSVLDKEQAYAGHADDRPDDFAWCDALMEKPGGGCDDEYGGEGEQGLGNACGGVHGGQQRHAGAHKGAEERCPEGAPHGFAVAHGVAELCKSVFLKQQEQCHKSRQSHGGAYHRRCKGDADVQWHGQQRVRHHGLPVQPNGKEGGIVVLQAYLAQHQSAALADAGKAGIDYPTLGEIELQLRRMVCVVRRGVPLGEDGEPYARQCHAHAKDGQGAHLLADEQPSRNGCGGSGEGHEKLPEAGADGYIALKKAVVAYHVPHHAGKEEPQPRLPVCIARPRHTHEKPEGEGQESQRHDHAYHIQRQRAHALGCHLGKEGCDRPRQGHKKGDDFTDKHGTITADTPFYCPERPATAP